MFTGLVEGVGTILRTDVRGKERIIEVRSKEFDTHDVSIGDSISVNGVCLTVVDLTPDVLKFDVSPETLKVISDFNLGDEVNLEKALRFSDRLGGHLVTGHVDAVGIVLSVNIENNNYQLQVRYPKSIGKYISRKGSIAVNGVSLTVNSIINERFSVNLIPHTWQATSLKNVKENSLVNLEIDLMARYIERMLVERTK